MPDIAVAGARLHYLEEGEGEPLVLLHGNAGSGEVWRKTLPPLSRKYRVIAHDRRGFGRSEPTEPADASPAGYARELALLMDALGIGSAHVAGLSFGGMTALQFALDFPERVRRLILIGATANRTARSVPETLAELQRDGWPDVARRLVGSWFRPESHSADVDEAYRIAMQSSQRMREVTIRALGTFDINDEIAAITAPALILVGEQDRTCPLEMSETIRERVAGARLVVVPDSAHLVPVEKPDRCAEHMLDFLSALKHRPRMPEG